MNVFANQYYYYYYFAAFFGGRQFCIEKMDSPDKSCQL